MQTYTLGDESIAMVGEFRREERGDKKYYYISGSILNVRFYNEKVVIGCVPKYRVSSGGTIGDSFYAFPYNDNLFVLYNDDPDNMDREIGPKFADSNKFRKLALIAASMDAEGKIQRKKLVDLSDQNFLPVGDQAYRLSPSSLLVPVNRIRGRGTTVNESKWAEIRVN